MARDSAWVVQISSQLGVCPRCGKELDGPGYGSGRLADGVFCSLSCFADFRELDGGPLALRGLEWSSGAVSSGQDEASPSDSTIGGGVRVSEGALPSVYVSGALTSASNLAEARALYESLGAVCSKEGFEPYIPHLKTDPQNHPDVTAVDVYFHDAREIAAASLVVAYLGDPSLGVGAELALATGLGTPIVALYRPSQPVSRFILGLLRTHGAHEVVAESDSELGRGLAAILADVRRRVV